MLGVFIGTTCLIGLIVLFRRRARRRMSYRLFRKLDTSPGQERVIRNARDALFSQISDLKKELRASRGDVARAVRSESFDESAIDDAYARQDEGITKLRKAASEALAKVHEVLDDRQRLRLAELLESGPGWAGMSGGPYRRWAGHRGTAC